MLTALRWAGAAACGLGAAAGFPPFDAVLLVPLAVAGLTLSCWRATVPVAGVAGLCFGLTFMAALLPWLQVIGIDAWLAVAVLESLFYALLGGALSLVTRLPGWPLWAAAAWVAAELARSSVPFGGLPWGRLGFALVDTPMAAYARLGGVALVTVAVVLAANLTLFGALRIWRDRGDWLPAAGALLGAVAVAIGGLAVPLATTGSTAGPVVAVVQGNVPGSGLAAYSERRAVLANHAQATHQLARRVDAGAVPAPDLVIWPENSTDIDPFTDPGAAATISAAISDVAAPTLVGAVTSGPAPGMVRNVGVVWSPETGPGARYVKRHPVPFGEYIPFRALLTRYIDRLAQIPSDFAAGSSPGVLSLGGARVGDLICFEVAYDGLVRDLVNSGAQLLVVQTNNATYLGTGQLAQQWAISRLRAIETGRTVVVAATNGISGFAAADGTVIDRSAPGTRAVLVNRVELAAEVPLGVRAGRWVEWSLAIAGVVASVAALVRSRRSVALARGGSA